MILPRGDSEQTAFSNIDQALSEPDTQIRLFGKPVIKGKRRMGVGLARGATIEDAIEKAKEVANTVAVTF